MTNTGMSRLGFGNYKPPAILERLKILYVPPSLKELEQALLRLHEPMDCSQLVEVMLRNTKEVQIFLMVHLYGDHELSNSNLISYAMIKLSKCGGLYTKAIERWQSKTAKEKETWETFCQHLITEYEKLLAEGVVTTLGQEV